MPPKSSVNRRQRVLSIIALAIIVMPMFLGAALKLSHAQPSTVITQVHPTPMLPAPAAASPSTRR